MNLRMGEVARNFPFAIPETEAQREAAAATFAANATEQEAEFVYALGAATSTGKRQAIVKYGIGGAVGLALGVVATALVMR